MKDSNIAKKNNDYKWFWERLDTYLKDQELKQTKQRKVIIDFFLELDTHVGAETLHERLRSAGHNFGLATIYRTLNLLREAGLAEQQSFEDGRSVFEIDRPGTHHDHLICLDCGTVLEFESETIEKLQSDIAHKHGFELKYHRHDLFAHCQDANCEKRKT